MENKYDSQVFVSAVCSLIPFIGVIFALITLFLYSKSSGEGMANTSQMVALFVLWVHFVASVVVIYHSFFVLPA